MDNLLSSERENLPSDGKIDFIEGSIAEDEILGRIDDEFDYIFHLATYHGNQNSIADPLADHDNNLVTTLKLYERIKRFKRLKKVVYTASGCVSCASRRVRLGHPDNGGRRVVSLDLDSPYQISKVVGEFYSIYFRRQHGLPTVRARFQNVYGPGEVLGAGSWRGTSATVWRNVVGDVRLPCPAGAAADTRRRRHCLPGFRVRRRRRPGPLCLCEVRGAGETSTTSPAEIETPIRRLAELVVELTGGTSRLELGPRRSWDRSVARFGSPDKARDRLGFQAGVPLEEGLRRTIDWTRAHHDFIGECLERHASRL